MDIKDRIIYTAFELFTKYGIRAVTMDQIAQQLGISKRTLYEVYKDKNYLLIKGMKVFIMKTKNEALEIIKNTNNVIEAIYELGKFMDNKKQKITPLFFEDIKKYYPGIHEQFFSKNKKSEYTFIHTLVEKGVKEGVFLKDLNIKMVNDYLYEMMKIIRDDTIFPKNEYSENEIFRNIIMPYFIGICTNKGQILIEKYFKSEMDSRK
jgi:hypothetical protein